MEKKTLVGFIMVCAALVAGASLWPAIRENLVLKPIEELKVRITSSTTIPDPANVQSSGDWYFLDHISGGLASYDSDTKKFSPLYASSWESRADGTHVFNLREGAKFHDGTPITVKDILWSLKRQLILKTSTHFPLWEYIVGCEEVKTLNDECDGLAEEGQGIAIRLKSRADSFYLQLASPETGIWSADDMNPKTMELKATKFSGSYYVAERTDDFAILKKNLYSPLIARFPESPGSIRIKRIPLPKLDQALLTGEVDLAVRSYNPLGERNWRADGFGVHSTDASTIIYLFGLGTGARPAVGKDFVQAAWSFNQDKVITPSDTFLPVGKEYVLSREEFLKELPERTAPTLRILCPDGFFSEKFLAQLQSAAQSVGARIEFSFAGPSEWFAAFNDPRAAEKHDYIMSSYAASERYPAVQLRYMTKKLLTPPIDLKKTESPDLDVDRAKLLRDYQRWLLQARQAIPLYFNPTIYVHRSGIDLGKQSTTDAEIELWRVRERGIL